MRNGAHRDEAERRQVQYLSSRAVHSRLAEVLADHGHHLLGARLVDLQHRPGAGATGIFRVRASSSSSSGAPARASEPQELYLALTAEAVPEDGALQAGEDADATWSAWFHPHDPLLTGLALASDPESVASLWGGGGTLIDLQTVSYRPLRRAVLRAVVSGEGGQRTVFLKVMRPGLATRLHYRHTLLAAAGVPVPAVLGPPVADVLALEQGEGEVLAAAIMADGARHVDPAAVLGVLDRMPNELVELPRRDAWSDRTGDYGHAAATALPDQARRIRSLVEHLQRQLDGTDRGPVVPTHGDFYEANLLVSQHRISGVLDIDGAGPGHRVDDLACFLGHLAVLPAVDHGYVHVDQALRRFHSVFVAGVDPAALACRSSAVALSLVAGARDSGHRDWESSARQRLDIAESLLDLPQSAAGW
ncbi:aminoglycoside phosphotransferase family protein [Citricoccus nitrophenolicus]|uniref:aminoglycoside phosphotransferase family protein n=1 Tax=Citricoccus nitrophenolicus TaxID=863575 RepID=UPI0039B44B61